LPVTTRGKDGVLHFFGAMAQQYDNTLNVQVREVLANDHSAVVLTAESGTVDGHQLEWRSAHVFSIADRVVVAFTSYQDDAYHAFWSARALV
jgi:hypothetical protein